MRTTERRHGARAAARRAPKYALVLAVACAGLLTTPSAAQSSQLAPLVDEAQPTDADGRSTATAAASCWEIKHNDSSAQDGTYWLYTPKLGAPQQFYCDMTTKGGGWVLVGRAREKWQTWYNGTGNADTLATGPTAPSTAIQLSSRTIDGLMNGAAVSDLPDGIRVERVTSRTDPSRVQNVYFAEGTRTMGWSWALGATNPVTSWRVEEAGYSDQSGSSGTTASFGAGSGRTRVAFNTDKAQLYYSGFAYGTDTSGPLGDLSASSYLYSAAANGTSARPFASVYLRPRLVSTNVNVAIDDSGAPPVTRARVADYRAAWSTWGVAGAASTYTGEGHVQVRSVRPAGLGHVRRRQLRHRPEGEVRIRARPGRPSPTSRPSTRRPATTFPPSARPSTVRSAASRRCPTTRSPSSAPSAPSTASPTAVSPC